MNAFCLAYWSIIFLVHQSHSVAVEDCPMYLTSPLIEAFVPSSAARRTPPAPISLPPPPLLHESYGGGRGAELDAVRELPARLMGERYPARVTANRTDAGERAGKGGLSAGASYFAPGKA